MWGFRSNLAVGASWRFLSLVSSSCARPSGLPVGVSPPRGMDRSAVQARSAAPAGGALFPADFRHSLSAVTLRKLSRGHAERFDAIVWANDVARVAWDGSGAMPDGALLLEEAIAPPERASERDKLLGLLVMRKDAGQWHYVAVGPDGGVAEESRTSRCAACHEQALRDSVFQEVSTIVTITAPKMAIVPNSVASAAATSEARSAGSAALPSSR